MISKDKASNYMAQHYKKIRQEINKLSKKQNFAGVLQAVINYQRQLVQDGKIAVLARHIRFQAWVYKRGTTYVKELMENLFVRSFSSLRRQCRVEQWAALYRKIPAVFKRIYLQQQKDTIHLAI